ncbi:hypothetical protein PWT90_06416 [Aphanocladium album]|nr:hypothetical protein PWT90_06416 [Aphanocladium album]
MKPPPSTPTPRRFLTKRPASSQLPHSTPTPMRFQSTPRFGSTQSASRQMEDVEELDVDTSQSQSQSQASVMEQPRSDRRDIVSDSIEVDSYADSLASQEQLQSSGSSEHEMDDNTSSGRQKGYLSGLEDIDHEAAVVNIPAAHVYEDVGTPPVKRRRLSASTSPPRLRMADPYGSDTGLHEDLDASEQDESEKDEEADVQDKTRTRAPVQQPTFRPAPRFKPAPDDELFAHNQDGGPGAILTAPFSPQRRGAKYVPGGLASQLQGLLSQVKGAETLGGAGSDGTGDGAIVRLVVEDARAGTRMHLIRGRILSRGSVSESTNVLEQYVLAGAGERLVKPGSVLRIMATPAWDVHLGEEWTVACEWNIESLEGHN